MSTQTAQAQAGYSETVEKARSYYNSSDADNFYYHVWGSEDIHVGMYLHDKEDIATASRRTVEVMLASIRNTGKNLRILDIGGGYGGAARTIAREAGHQVAVLNLSEAENERGRAMNREQGLAELIDTIDGNFEEIPFDKDHFDIIWSQDAILHSSRRDTVLREAFRVLKPGGEFVFTDPMRSDDTQNSSIQPILDRIHLDSLSSPGTYFDTGRETGFTDLKFLDFGNKLPMHYQRVLEETEANESRLVNDGLVSQDYIDNMKKGLGHWIEGGNAGRLTWGIFHFRKP